MLLLKIDDSILLPAEKWERDLSIKVTWKHICLNTIKMLQVPTYNLHKPLHRTHYKWALYTQTYAPTAQAILEPGTLCIHINIHTHTNTTQDGWFVFLFRVLFVIVFLYVFFLKLAAFGDLLLLCSLYPFIYFLPFFSLSPTFQLWHCYVTHVL